jgi:hypothetical protein
VGDLRAILGGFRGSGSFDFDNQEKIDPVGPARLIMKHHVAAARALRNGKKVWMGDVKTPSVDQADVKTQKWGAVHCLSNLLDGRHAT